MANNFQSFFGDENLTNLDLRLQGIVNALPTNAIKPVSDNISGEFIDAFIDTNETSEIKRILESATISKSRIDRYGVYDEAYKYVPVIKRMMKVYIASILQKNPITGQCIIIKKSDKIANDSQEDDINAEKALNLAKHTIEHFNLTTKLKRKILPNELLYGDSFIEIVNVNDESKKESATVSTSMEQQPIFENLTSQLNKLNNSVEKNVAYTRYDHLETILEQTAKLFVDYDETVLYDEEEIIIESITDEVDDDKSKDKSSATKEDNEQEIDLSNVLLRLHRPHNIIVLETNYGTILGYLIVSKEDVPQSINLTQSLSTLVGKITTVTGKDQINQDVVTDRLVRYIIKNCLDKAKAKSTLKTNVKNIDQLLKGLDPTVYKYVKRLFVEQDIVNKGQYNRLKVRFVPTSRMIQFSIPSAEFDPYGESFVDALVFPCKLYIVSQLSNVITKLSRAAPVRKWTIDSGATQMQAGLIQKLKRELYNTRITLDDLSSFKNIPKLLSDFKDMFLISKNGQKSIDVEIASHGDPTVRVADLEDARREIMSLSGIPPAYLGYADIIELREQLIHTNVSFAAEISDIQEGISNGLSRILDITAEIQGYGYKPSEYIKITLVPPIVLILQLIEMTLSSLGNISGVFQTLNIPTDPYYLLEQYIPHIDWAAFRDAANKYQTTNKIKAEIQTAKDNADMNAGGGETQPQQPAPRQPAAPPRQ